MNDIGISTRKPDPVARARALGPGALRSEPPTMSNLGAARA